MKDDTRAHLARAIENLERADVLIGLIRETPLLAADAARIAYYAAFHAAKAMIFERTGGKSKKHGSVHNAFAEVTAKDASVDSAVRTFLAKAYEYKRVGDYETGTASQISLREAEVAVADAKRFVAVVVALLQAGAS